MSSFNQASTRSRNDEQASTNLQSIDEDVERMNFNLISVQNSIRRMSTARQRGNQSYLSLLANQAQSRNTLETFASKLLSSRKLHQEKPFRFWNKRAWEQENKLIVEVAATEQLSEKTTALLIASRKKMFAKKMQLFKLTSELKNMNLETVTLAFVFAQFVYVAKTQF